MKGITLATLMIVGILAFAALAIGLSYAKYDEATTTVTLDDGIKCCINGKEVSDGDTVTVKLEAAKLKICVSSEYDQPIGYAGKWTCGDKTVTSSKTDDSTVKSGEFVIDLNHGSYTGAIKIKFVSADMNGQKITMKFTIADGLNVTYGSTTVNNGDSIEFTEDTIYISVATADGEKKNISYSYWWGDSSESGSGSGSEYNTSIQIIIDNMAYFDPQPGEVKIWL